MGAKVHFRGEMMRKIALITIFTLGVGLVPAAFAQNHGEVGAFFDYFRLDNRPATFGTFTSSVDNLRTDNVNGVVYPGGGVEFYLGPIGIRGEAGDEIYFNHGAHNNLRVAIGPNIRF